MLSPIIGYSCSYYNSCYSNASICDSCFQDMLHHQMLIFRLTQFMVDASNLLRNPIQIFKLVPLLLLLTFILKRLFKKESFQFRKDALLLKLPLTKELITKSSLANFSRTLSALNSAGVPILESLFISKKTIGNRVFKRVVNKMIEEIQYGNPLYKVLASEKVIPTLFTSMFRIGDETGN